MVSELLLWPFSLAILSLLVLLHSQHRFRRHKSCCSLLPLNLQCLPAVVFGSRPAATIVEESYTAQTTACVITAVNIAPIFCRYHWDRFAPIYTLVEASQPSEIARTLTCHPNILRQISRITRAFTCLHAPDLHLLTLTLGDIICWHHCPPFADVTRHASWHQAVDPCWPYRWLDHWLWPMVDFNCWLFARVDFRSPGAPYPVFHVDFIFTIHFCIFCF